MWNSLHTHLIIKLTTQKVCRTPLLLQTSSVFKKGSFLLFERTSLENPRSPKPLRKRPYGRLFCDVTKRAHRSLFTKHKRPDITDVTE